MERAGLACVGGAAEAEAVPARPMAQEVAEIENLSKVSAKYICAFSVIPFNDVSD